MNVYSHDYALYTAQHEYIYILHMTILLFWTEIRKLNMTVSSKN